MVTDNKTINVNEPVELLIEELPAFDLALLQGCPDIDR